MKTTSAIDTRSMLPFRNQIRWAFVLALLLFGRSTQAQGYLYAWGLNSRGQLGLGNNDTTARTLPTSAIIPQTSIIRSVAGGGTHTLVVRSSDGTVWAWGKNENGQ